MASLSWVCFIALCSAVLASDVPDTPGFAVANVTSYNLMSQNEQSQLYNCTLSNDPYEVPIYVVHLKGSRYQMGVDYATVAGALAVEMYTNVLNSLFGHHPLAQKAFEMFVDWQWDSFLSRQVPSSMMTEIEGIKDGSSMMNLNTPLDKIVTRVIVLANLPSDLEDMIYVFEDEFGASNGDLVRQAAELLLSRQKNPGLQCSQFAVWGSRTEGNALFSARNLDYAQDLGVDPYKTVFVWEPNDGAHAHASFGYIALYGALTAMNNQGVTIGEANLEVAIAYVEPQNEETFLGFPWVLRIRYVLEHSRNLVEAWALWEHTNNTVGYNHMIASAEDVAQGHPALAIETMKGYNGFFLDNDPREYNAKAVDPSTNETFVYGAPLEEALWRTNHGYDPKIRAHYMWRTFHAGQWSAQRYKFAHDAFVYYETEGIKISAVEAMNITSIIGDKGETDPYKCSDTEQGSNILSVTYDPGNLIAYSAWDNGSGSAWRPACCNTYVLFDLRQFFDA